MPSSGRVNNIDIPLFDIPLFNIPLFDIPLGKILLNPCLIPLIRVPSTSRFIDITIF
jgi:hypothetical protein